MQYAPLKWISSDTFGQRVIAQSFMAISIFWKGVFPPLPTTPKWKNNFVFLGKVWKGFLSLSNKRPPQRHAFPRHWKRTLLYFVSVAISGNLSLREGRKPDEAISSLEWDRYALLAVTEGEGDHHALLTVTKCIGNCAKISQLGKLYTNFWVSFSHKEEKYEN